MEDSATYQAIVRRGRELGREEGTALGERRLLLMQGETKFGPPDAATRAALEGITDVGQLEALGLRLLSAVSWQELLPLQPRRRGNSRRRSRE